MKRITGQDLEMHMPFFLAAAIEAKQATCKRARCGSVIVNNGKVLGTGYNSPPQNKESQRTCNHDWDTSKKPKYDLTCCVHAEWRAVINACKSGAELDGATLYFMRINQDGDFTDAGVPYCTTCSRLTMEAGVSNFALWNQDGADLYKTDEYNEQSYAYFRKDKS